MKIAKRIDITYKEIVNRGDVSAILLVDSEKGTSGWILQIKRGEDIIRVEASSSTVLALMMAERNFSDSTTGFYEVDGE